MLTANTGSLPAVQALAPLPRRPFLKGFRKLVAHVFRHLARAGRGVAPDVPDDLLADVGLEAPQVERGEAFWRGRQRSVGRDLPI